MHMYCIFVFVTATREELYEYVELFYVMSNCKLYFYTSRSTCSSPVLSTDTIVSIPRKAQKKMSK